MSLHVVSGEDSFGVSHCVTQLRNQWMASLPPELTSLLYQRLDNPRVDTVINQLQAQVFALGGTPVLEITGFTGFKEAIDKDDWRNALQEALTDAEESKHVLWISPKIDRKFKWVKWLLALPQCQHHNFDPIAPWETAQAEDRLHHMAKTANIPLTPAAAAKIIETLGTDFFAMAQVLQQGLLLSQGKPLAPEHVRPFMADSDNVFKAVEAWVSQANPPDVRWRMWLGILDNDNPHRLLALLTKLVTDYWLVKTMTAQRQPPQAIAAVVGKKPGWVSVQLKWLAKVPTERLAMLHRQLATTEWHLKTGQLPPRLAMEQLWAY
jgi:DNA polymerase III delta subunit